jgi:von Willebrand factor type A domain
VSWIPLADAARLRSQARRTLAVRIVLAGLAVACLVAAILVSREAGGARRTFFANARSSVVVVDTSGSIGPVARSLIGRTLRKLLAAHSAFGLVFFSDTAYEAVPPGTRWTELEPLLRYFEPPPAERPRRRQDTPWSEFRGGTRISTGLALARAILRQRKAGDSGVLLISDLDNSIFDAPALTQTLTQYVTDRIPLRVIGLEARPRDELIFQRLVGPSSIVTDAELPAPRAAAGGSVVTSSVGPSTALTLAALALLLVLGAYEHWSARLRWREEPA